MQGGSSIWRRGADAVWVRQKPLDGGLRGTPGRADVWADEETACAVLLEDRRLAVACLEWRGDGHSLAWRPAEIPMDGRLETATLARDGRGTRWVADGLGPQMWAQRSTDSWRRAVKVSATPAAEDDICAVVAVSDGVGSSGAIRRLIRSGSGGGGTERYGGSRPRWLSRVERRQTIISGHRHRPIASYWWP